MNRRAGGGGAAERVRRRFTRADAALLGSAMTVDWPIDHVLFTILAKCGERALSGCRGAERNVDDLSRSHGITTLWTPEHQIRINVSQYNSSARSQTVIPLRQARLGLVITERPLCRVCLRTPCLSRCPAVTVRNPVRIPQSASEGGRSPDGASHGGMCGERTQDAEG